MTGADSGSTVSTVDVEEYVQAVADALAGLPAEVRDDLLDDLPDHLAEIAAEGGGSLRDRLGDPADYAAELRVAAGFDAAQDEVNVASAAAVRTALADGVRRGRDNARRLDVQLGRLMGYPRSSDLLRALAPGWWVLRGWLVAQLVCSIGDSGRGRGVIPLAGTSRLGGVAITVVAVFVSVWMGRRARGASLWPRGLLVAANLLIAVSALLVSNGVQTWSGTTYVVTPASATYIGGSDASDVYVYDANGNLVPGARLYDQDGNPVQLGTPYCMNGDPAPGAVNSDPSEAVDPKLGPAWTYPLCPDDPSPFRAGPGPASPGPASPGPAMSASPTPSSPARSAPSTTARSSSVVIPTH